MRRLIVIITAALGLSSCFESTAFDTECIITPVTQAASGDDYIDLAGVICYAFEGTTDNWSILSYEDALAGIVTSESGEQRTASVTAEPYNGSTTLLTIPLDREYMIIWGVDPSSEIYCYIDYEVPENFYELYVTLTFIPWKVSNYTIKSWTYVVPPFESVEYTLSVNQKLDSSSDSTPLSGTLLYAFVDCTTSDWGFASYEDALAGIATSTESGEQISATITATASGEDANEYLLTLEEGSVMLLVVDPATEVYGYTNYTVTAKVRTDSADVTFNLWQEADYTSSGWSFVVPYVEVEEEDEETDTEENLTEDETEI